MSVNISGWVFEDVKDIIKGLQPLVEESEVSYEGALDTIPRTMDIEIKILYKVSGALVIITFDKAKVELRIPKSKLKQVITSLIGTQLSLNTPANDTMASALDILYTTRFFDEELGRPYSIDDANEDF